MKPKLESIINKNSKPKMENCKVFKVNVANAPPEDVAGILKNCEAIFSEKFDTSNTIFVPVRGKDDPTGWQ